MNHGKELHARYKALYLTSEFYRGRYQRIHIHIATLKHTQVLIGFVSVKLTLHDHRIITS